MSEVLLDVRHLKKYFAVPKGQLHAVDDVSFTIERGKTLGIVGESGCGKSTLGRTILKLQKPTAGSIIYNDLDITDFTKREMRSVRNEMQIIFQDPYASLDPRYTVQEILEEPMIINNTCPDAASRERRVEELMDMVSLSRRFQNSYPHEFDGGRRQRIVIARALSLNPKFIVCDEPVSALDVSIQAQILNLLKNLQRELGLTYIFISHDLSVVRHISDDVGVMYLGQLVEKSPKKEIYRQPLHPYTIALLSAIPIPDPDNSRKKIILSGELTSPINIKAGCRFAARCPFAREECHCVTPPLRELMPGHFVACHRAEDVRDNKISY